MSLHVAFPQCVWDWPGILQDVPRPGLSVFPMMHWGDGLGRKTSGGSAYSTHPAPREVPAIHLLQTLGPKWLSRLARLLHTVLTVLAFWPDKMLSLGLCFFPRGRVPYWGAILARIWVLGCTIFHFTIPLKSFKDRT